MYMGVNMPPFLGKLPDSYKIKILKMKRSAVKVGQQTR